MKTKRILILLVIVLLAPSFCFAKLNGEKADEVKVNLYYKRSPVWKDYVKALEQKTNSDGVLKARNVLEGWYKIKIDDDDQKSGQSIAVKLRVLSEKSKYVKNAKVKLYTKVGDDKYFIKEVDTDKNGYFETEGLVSGHEYYIEVNTGKNDIRNFSKKPNQPRIKALAKKIGIKKKGEKWLQALYARTDENQVLDVGKIQQGFYKFSLKYGDTLPQGFFNVQAQVLSHDAEKIKKPTVLKLYAYPNKVRTFIGEVTTDEDGNIFLPKLVPEITYRVIVKD